MNFKNALAVVAAFVAGVLVSATYPVVAQQTDVDAAWEVTVSRPANNNVSFVKHNRITGQTLVLSCVMGLCQKQKWIELPITTTA